MDDAAAVPAVSAGEIGCQQRRPRDTHADAVRGIAIAALVLSHTLTIAVQTPQVASLNDFIVSWNMPLFFFVAGWAMALQPLHTPLLTVERRARSLLVPYLAWICVLWVVGFPWSGGASGLGGWFEILFAPREMWFLYCLFLAIVLFTVIRSVGRRPVVAMGSVVLLALAATWAAQRLPGGLLTLANLGWLLPFLAAGFYGCQISRRAPRLPALAKLGLSAVAVTLLWMTVAGGLPLLIAGGGVVAQLLNHSLRYALAAAGIATVWQLLRLVPARAGRGFAGLGMATLAIYALNSPALTAVRILFPTWSVVADPGYTVLVVAGVALIVLGTEWVVALLLGRIGITRRVLLGRWASPRTPPES